MRRTQTRTFDHRAFVNAAARFATTLAAGSLLSPGVPLPRLSTHLLAKAPTSQPLLQPADIRSRNGVLEATITAAPGAVRLGDHEFSGMLYNGAHIPPTLRARLGDTLRITFRNILADRSQVDHPGYVGPVCTGAGPHSNRWNGDSLRDTFSVPPATDQGPGALKAVIPFTDPAIVGRFVYHCHAVDHEDKA